MLSLLMMIKLRAACSEVFSHKPSFIPCISVFEAPWEDQHNAPAAEWPERGEVALMNYATRYRKGLDLVLQGITFTAKPAEKVGKMSSYLF